MLLHKSLTTPICGEEASKKCELKYSMKTVVAPKISLIHVLRVTEGPADGNDLRLLFTPASTF